MQLNELLLNIGRIGLGAIFLFSVAVDLATRKEIFNLMRIKNVPQPWIFYMGAIAWKALTGGAIIANFHPVAASLLLALYILIANMIFNNFWAVPIERRGFSVAMFLIYLASCFGLLLVAGASAV